MIEINVEIAGDHWLNPQQVKQQLDRAGSDPVLLDFGAEGPSLAALGILDMLNAHCQHNNVNPTTVVLKAWSNPVETVPFARWEPQAMRLSHFFWMCRDYWQPMIPSQRQHRLAMFVGRRTPARCGIMWDLYQDWGHRVLFSRMNTQYHDVHVSSPGINLEEHESWIADTVKFDSWWHQSPPASIDGYSVADQYRPNINTNASLLMHYPKFDVELVCETYTRGETFFPTEKTIRPIMAGRPILVYGPRNFLSRMRDLGFQTWGNIWDEDYDRLQGRERWTAMRHVVNHIMTQQDWHDVYQHTKQTQLHNRQRLEELIKEYAPQ